MRVVKGCVKISQISMVNEILLVFTFANIQHNNGKIGIKYRNAGKKREWISCS